MQKRLKDKTFLRDEVLKCKRQDQEEKKSGGGLSRLNCKHIKIITLNDIAEYVLGTSSSEDLDAWSLQALKKALEELKKAGLAQNKFFQEHYSTLTTLEDFVENNVSVSEFVPSHPQVYEGRLPKFRGRNPKQ
jgi:hypothetical protein